MSILFRYRNIYPLANPTPPALTLGKPQPQEGCMTAYAQYRTSGPRTAPSPSAAGRT